MTFDYDSRLRRVAWTVAILNLAYFGVEFVVALTIESLSLFADSIDFLEDASINILILIALGYRADVRARVGKVLAGMILIPGMATLVSAWDKFYSLTIPDSHALSITGMGALVINFVCALILSKTRDHGGSLAKAAFLSARNDVLANVAIIVTGLITAFSQSGWPDFIVGLGIAAMNAGAAWEVYTTARSEQEDLRS